MQTEKTLSTHEDHVTELKFTKGPKRTVRECSVSQHFRGQELILKLGKFYLFAANFFQLISVNLILPPYVSTGPKCWFQ